MSSVPVSNGGNNWMNIDITFEGWTVKEDYDCRTTVLAIREHRAVVE